MTSPKKERDLKAARKKVGLIIGESSGKTTYAPAQLKIPTQPGCIFKNTYSGSRWHILGGGKLQDGVYQTIINQIPSHKVYIELFLGGGAIMIKKRPADRNIGVEFDKDAIENFTLKNKIELLNINAFKFLEDLAGKNTYKRSFDGKITYSPRETFIYCDPPYPHGSRKSNKRYNFELSDEDHFELLRNLKKLGCNIAISTYPNEIYSSELEGWRLIDYKSMTRGGYQATEYLYMNYPEPVFLHDDRYLGADSNNRQDISRRIERTKKRILQWDPRERIKLIRNLVKDLPEDEKKLFRRL